MANDDPGRTPILLIAQNNVDSVRKRLLTGKREKSGKTHYNYIPYRLALEKRHILGNVEKQAVGIADTPILVYAHYCFHRYLSFYTATGILVVNS